MIYAIANGQHLYEFTPASLRAFQAASGRKAKVLHWTQAHKWVRDGGSHSTGLYLDGDRIRRAS